MLLHAPSRLWAALAVLRSPARDGPLWAPVLQAPLSLTSSLVVTLPDHVYEARFGPDER